MRGSNIRPLKAAVSFTAISLLASLGGEAWGQACPGPGAAYTVSTGTADGSQPPAGATGEGTHVGILYTPNFTNTVYNIMCSGFYLGSTSTGLVYRPFVPPMEFYVAAWAWTPILTTGGPSSIYPYYSEYPDTTVTCFESSCVPDPTRQLYSMFGNIWGFVHGKDGRGRDVPLAGTEVTAVEVYNHYKSRVVRTDRSGAFTFRSGFLPVDDEYPPPTGTSYIPTPIPDANKWGLRVWRAPEVGHGEGRSFWKVSTTKAVTNPIDLTSNHEAFVVLEGYYEKGKGDPDDRQCPAEGEPVSIMTGNVFLDQTDMTLAGPRGDLAFTRSYNSRAAYRGASGPFGRGWSHTWSTHVVLDGRFISYIGPSGVPEYLSDHDDDGTYDAYAPPDVRDTIVRTATGFRRDRLDGGVENFDADGRLTSVSDAVGATTSLTYDAAARLVGLQGPGGRSLTLTYSTGEAQLIGPDGLVARYELDGANLERVTYADGTGYRYQYDATGQLLTMTDLAGTVLEHHAYDADKATLSEVGAGQERYSFAYAPGVTTVTDGLGNVTNYAWQEIGEVKRVTRIEGPCSSCGGGADLQIKAYDSQARLTSATNGLGEQTTFHYDAAGNLDEFHDATGRVWFYEYDTHGRLTKETAPGGAVRQMSHGPAGPLSFTDALLKVASVTYTPNGQVETITNRRGKATTFTYYPNGDLQKVRDPLGHETTYEYDAMGRRTKVTTPAGSTRAIYDPRGRARRVEGPEGTKVEFEYDLSGRLAAVKDALGRTTRRIYDAAGRLESMLDPTGGVTRYGYDPMSRLTSLTDARGQTTGFDYDSYGRVVRMVYPGGAFEGYTYDGAGRLKTKTDRKSVVTTYSYDGAGRLTGLTFSDGTPAVSYTYDPAGRLWTAVNGSDNLTFGYDLNGRLLSEASTRNASTVSVTYDDAGNRLSLSLDGQLHLGYTWDDDGRLDSLTQGARTFGFGYDAAERRTSLSYPNGVVTGYSYDGASRLTHLRAALGATTVTDFVYSYDVVGNRLGVTRPEGVEGYAYDALDRLVRVDRNWGATRLWSYGYDVVGNRITDQVGDSVTTSSYDARNQLLGRRGGGSLLWRGVLDEPGSVSVTSATINGKPARMLPGNVFEAEVEAQAGANQVTLAASDARGNVRTNTYQVEVPGSSVTYTYDANGSLETKTDSSGSWSFEWNALGQLVRVVKAGVEAGRFAYDALGRRVEKVAGGSATSYTYDGMDILRERAGGTTIRYVHGPGIDEPLARDVGGLWAYLHADALGSIRRETDAAGEPGLQRDYDAWGQPVAGVGVPGYAYTGREWDPETQLYYYRARYYDPKIGRFLSEDPMGFDVGQNFYAYVDNRPTVFADPLGLAPAGAEKRYGLPDAFWEWFHRQVKRTGDPDLTEEQARELKEEWERGGRPGPDHKGKHSGRGRGRGRGWGRGWGATLCHKVDPDMFKEAAKKVPPEVWEWVRKFSE